METDNHNFSVSSSCLQTSFPTLSSHLRGPEAWFFFFLWGLIFPKGRSKSRWGFFFCQNSRMVKAKPLVWASLNFFYVLGGKQHTLQSIFWKGLELYVGVYQWWNIVFRGAPWQSAFAKACTAYWGKSVFNPECKSPHHYSYFKWKKLGERQLTLKGIRLLSNSSK